MAYVQFQSREYERLNSGRTLKVTYTGSFGEMSALADAPETENGYSFASARISQKSGAIWQCEMRYSAGSDGSLINNPEEQEYGKKSCQLKVSMLSMPLESHRDYRTNWSYYLASKPGVTAVPDWWATAADPLLTGDAAANYAWIKGVGETPVDAKSGKRWNLLKKPQKPGMETYDMYTYSITETARYQTAVKAGTMVKNMLNRIGKPVETFGINVGNWKCDSCDISWNGKCWVATRTWTLSGGVSGWDPDFYKPVGT